MGYFINEILGASCFKQLALILSITIYQANAVQSIGFINGTGEDIALKAYIKDPVQFTQCFIPTSYSHIYILNDVVIIDKSSVVYFNYLNEKPECSNQFFFHVIYTDGKSDFLGYDPKAGLEDRIRYKLITKESYLLSSISKTNHETLLLSVMLSGYDK